MSILKVNEVQVFNGSTITLTATTTAASGAVTVGGNLTVSGAISSSDASTTRTNLGLGTLATRSFVLDSTSVGGYPPTAEFISYVTSNSTQVLFNKIDLNDQYNFENSLPVAFGGTGLTSIGTAGQVLKVNSGATALEFADESGGGGSGSAYIEHSSTVSDSLAISSGTNRMYVGNTSFSSGGVTMAGTLVVAGGYANFTSASALNITGTLNVI